MRIGTFLGFQMSLLFCQQLDFVLLLGNANLKQSFSLSLRHPLRQSKFNVYAHKENKDQERK
jgi:hypothetical protein